MNTKTNSRKRSWIQPNEHPAARTGMLLLLLLALPATVQAAFTYTINSGAVTITGYTGPGGVVNIPSTLAGLPVTSIGYRAFWQQGLNMVILPNTITNIGQQAFYECGHLTNTVIPNSVISLGDGAFSFCSSLASVTIGNSVTSIGRCTFYGCYNLTRVALPDGLAGIDVAAFAACSSLTSVTIPNTVTSIGDQAFMKCGDLEAIYFKGDAPGLGGSYVFFGDNASVYYLRGTTGWNETFGGLPTALWIQAPTIQTAPQTQTAEAGSDVGLRVQASSPLSLSYFWCRNAAEFLSCGTNWQLELPNVQLAQSGAYTVVISNALGAATSAPALLNVIAPVERRPVAGIQLTGTPGSLLNVDYADFLAPAPNWTTLGSVNLTNTSQYYFDAAAPIASQRLYRAWQANTLSAPSALHLHIVPAITLTGSIDSSLRVDYINQFGPVNAWVTLDTLTLTSSPQLYFDTSSIGQPPRLYRLIPLP